METRDWMRFDLWFDKKIRDLSNESLSIGEFLAVKDMLKCAYEAGFSNGNRTVQVNDKKYPNCIYYFMVKIIKPNWKKMIIFLKINDCSE